jgi:glyoxylase-like metal-dependent hydrolase (beta-lactamase superfamily II)
MNSIIYRDPHITVFQSALFQTNSTVVQTDDMVLVVDPAWLPEEVKNIRRYVDDIRGKKPLFMVFTHADYDHIIGYRAFNPDKIFISKAMADRTDKEEILKQITDFDQHYYINRSYPIEFPEAEFKVFRDGVQFRSGETKMTFYLMPGHTVDSMMVVVWQLGLCIAGDYLSDVEFPLIEYSSVAYENSLEKLPHIHDRNWFTRLIPGHGSPALVINDWLTRRTESLSYIYALRESIATGVPFNEEALWEKYQYSVVQKGFHEANIALMTQEYEENLWVWDPEQVAELQAFREEEPEMAADAEAVQDLSSEI